MTAVELTRALERGEVDNAGFRHASHLRVAWTYLCESESVEQASEKMSATLRRFAAAAGVPEKFHETITQFWMRLLAPLRESNHAIGFDKLVQTYPRLLEKNLPLDYYSAETLWSDRARFTWVEPDLKPLCSDAIDLCPSGPARHAPHRAVS